MVVVVVEYQYLVAMFVDFSYFFEHISSYEHFLAQRQVVDTASPAEHIGRGLGATRALWNAWQAVNLFFSVGVEKTISLVSAREAFLCTYVICKISSAFCPLTNTQVRHVPGRQ